MWKKALLAFSLFTFVAVATAVPLSHVVEAKGFRSGKKSFSKTPSQPQSNVRNNDSATSSKTTSGTTTSTTNRGFFGGGSFMKGMMVGGIAGMLFGGMFGGMGAFGNMLGFIVNVLALFVLFMVCRAIYDAYKRRRDSHRPNSGGRW